MKNHETKSKSIHYYLINYNILKFIPSLISTKYNNKTSSVHLTIKEILLIFFVD